MRTLPQAGIEQRSPTAKHLPMKPRELKRWINRQRVLLAIYMHAESDRPIARVWNTRLREEAGIGEDAVKQALRELVELGHIVIPPEAMQSRATGGRAIVLMDDPDARNFLDFLQVYGLEYGYSPDWREEDAAMAGGSGLKGPC